MLTCWAVVAPAILIINARVRTMVFILFRIYTIKTDLWRQFSVMLQNTKKLRFLVFNVILMLIGMQEAFSQDGNNYLDISSSIKNVNFNSVSTLETEQIQ